MVLGYCGMYWLSASLQQAGGNLELDRLLATNRAAKSIPGKMQQLEIPDGGLVGKVEIPRLQLSAVVFQGVDDSELSEGVGHVDQSALPGQTGNVVLAAHRDSFFRGLRNIRQGDRIQIVTENGQHEYLVRSTEIVKPTDVRVMAPTPDSEVTLITCYPFYFVGHAPKRFIVHAQEEHAQEEEETEARSSSRADATDESTSAESAEADTSAPRPSWRHPIQLAEQLLHRETSGLPE